MKIKISEKLFCEKENSPLLKPQEKDFHGIFPLPAMHSFLLHSASWNNVFYIVKMSVIFLTRLLHF